MKSLCTALAIASFTGFAPSALALSATHTVLKEIRTTSSSGEVSTRYIEAKLVVPGETVVYRLDYINDRNEPVTDMVLTMPVPPEVIYQDGTAEQPGTSASFSADDGQSFHPRTDVMITDAAGNAAPASAAHITHIRWAATTAVPANASGHLQFKATLR